MPEAWLELDTALKVRLHEVLDDPDRPVTEAELRKLSEEGRACTLILGGELQRLEQRLADVHRDPGELPWGRSQARFAASTTFARTSMSSAGSCPRWRVEPARPERGLAAGRAVAARPVVALARALFSCVPGLATSTRWCRSRAHSPWPARRRVRDVAYFQDRVETAGLAFLPAGIDYPERAARFEPFQAQHLALPFEERRAFLFPHMLGQLRRRRRSTSSASSCARGSRT